MSYDAEYRENDIWKCNINYLNFGSRKKRIVTAISIWHNKTLPKALGLDKFRLATTKSSPVLELVIPLTKTLAIFPVAREFHSIHSCGSHPFIMPLRKRKYSLLTIRLYDPGS